MGGVAGVDQALWPVRLSDGLDALTLAVRAELVEAEAT
jgi:hypothetical protein